MAVSKMNILSVGRNGSDGLHFLPTDSQPGVPASLEEQLGIFSLAEN